MIKYGPQGLCVDLPTEDDATALAKACANKLGETSKSGRGTFITLSDEYGNFICNIPVPGRH